MKNRLFSDTEDGRPFWQQRAWQFSAAFFAFMLCAGLIIAVSGGQDNGDGVSSAPPPATGPRVGDPASDVVADVASGESRPDGCRTDDDDQSAPIRPPKDLRWQALNGGKVPLSASAGPLRTRDPVLWCFAHTPMGAVMAANVIPRQMSGEGWRAATYQQVVAGIGRDLFQAMRSTMPAAPAQYVASSLAGFMLMSYSSTTATVRLLIRQGASLGATEYTVMWEGGDWKLVASSTGDLHTPVTAVSTAAGFVLWKS